MTPPNTFFVTSGTMSADAPSYVPRQADEDLYAGLSRGEFCYVLTPRQMGKSSLMVRTAARLLEEGVAVAVLDLTALGQNLTPEQWYEGLLIRLGRELGIEDELEDFWLAHERQGPLQRWIAAIGEVVLRRCTGRVVIFVDEIDYVRSLPFATDEFFAAIRECYNRRTQDPAFGRLVFCLLGVATPADLIRDTRTTPFNIGRRIELSDFSPTDAASLAKGLAREEKIAERLLRRILYWTGGHPYLTQCLGRAVAEDSSVRGTSGVDRLCEALFLSPRAQAEDNNIIFVRERLLRNEADRASLLDLYARVRRRKRVRDEDTNLVINLLRLAGVVRVVEGYLYVRNRIYFWVFDREWIKAHMPDPELRRQRAAFWRGVFRTSAVAGVILTVMVAMVLYANHQTRRADEQAHRADEQAQRADEQARRAEQNFQHALNAANSMVSQLAYGLQPILGTQSKTLEGILAAAERVYEGFLGDAGDSTAVLEGKARMLVAYTDIYLRLGNTNRALSRAREAGKIMERLTPQDPSNAQWQRDLSISHDRIGDVLVAQGERAQALEVYRASLTIAERLTPQDPGNAQWQRDLSISHDRIGDVLVAQGERAQALEVYRASLTIRERLAQQDPGNAQWQRDLSVSHDRIGDVLVAQGERAQALEVYRASLTIRARLAQQDPGNAEWQRDLSVSHEKVGNVLVAQGERAQALEVYRASLTIRERLAQQDPGNAQWQRDLSVSHEKVGDVLVAQGERAQALEVYRASLTIRERLAQQDPGNAQWQSDLSYSHSRLFNLVTEYEHAARVHATSGRTHEALEEMRVGLQLHARLIEKRLQPGHSGPTPSATLREIANIFTEQSNYVGVLQAYHTAVEYHERLAAQEPSRQEWGNNLSLALNGYAWTLLTAEPGDLRDPVKALEVAHRAVQLSVHLSEVEQAMILDTLAMAHHLTGDHTQAIVIAGRALALVPLSTTDERDAALRQEIESHLSAFQVAQHAAQKSAIRP